jgi:hypothetical protein
MVGIALIGDQNNASSVSNIPHPTLQLNKALACILNQGMVYQLLRKHTARSHSLEFVVCKMMETFCRRKLCALAVEVLDEELRQSSLKIFLLFHNEMYQNSDQTRSILF